MDEFGKSHFALGSVGDLSGLVLPLQAHLSAVAFEKEVAQFHEGNGSTVVDVQPKEVLDDIVSLVLGLLVQNFHNEGIDIIGGELSLGVLELVEVSFQAFPDAALQGLGASLHSFQDM